MFSSAGLIGLAIVLTLLASLGIAYLEQFAISRGAISRPLERPGAIALLVGAGLAATVTGHADGNWFIAAAAAFAVLSGLPWLRRGGQLTSLGLLWAGASWVVLILGAEIPAFGITGADVLFTGFLLAAFCALLREADAAGSFGWFFALVSAGAMTAMCYAIDRNDDAALGVLITGAVFGVIAATPFGSGMLSRVGSRFIGLVIGAMAIRAAVGSPRPMIGVTVVGVTCLIIWVISLERPYRLRVLLVGVAAGGAMAVLSLPALQAVREIYRPMKNTVAQSRGLMKTNPEGGLRAATQRLVIIEREFRSYANRLNRPQVQVARFIPFMGANVRVTTASARAAAQLSAQAQALINRVNVRAVSPTEGLVNRDELMRLAGALEEVQFVISRAETNITSTGRDLLVPELRAGVDDLIRQIAVVKRRVQTTLDGTAVADRLLGFSQPRTFFIAVQNTAESRATGGYAANFGIVTMQNGHVQTRRFDRTSLFDEAKDKPRILRAPLDFRRRYSQFDVDRNWWNVNMSPDFPTVARVMADQYRQYSGRSVDGVIAVDPIGLAQLMNLTGPLSVPPWPVPLTPDNAAKIMLHDEYVFFDSLPSERVAFLGRVANQVFDHLAYRGFNNLLVTGPLIDDLTATRRLQFWSPDPAVQKFFRETNSAGNVQDVVADSVMVTTQNAAGNKTDYFLERSFAYDATVKKVSGGRLQVDSKLQLRLRNNAPSSGEPRYVIGPQSARFQPGQNRLFVTFYSPFPMESATIDGKKLTLDAQPELGRNAYSAFVDLPSRSTRLIEVQFSGTTNRTKNYVLDLWHQPLIGDEPYTLAVHGAGKNGELQYSGSLNRDIRISLPVGR